MAIGLDVGTMWLVSAKKSGDETKYTKLRNSFYCVEENDFMRDMLESIHVSYISKDGMLYILGDAGMELASSFQQEARRPMSQGLLSPKEKDALPIMKLMISELLGKPKVENEICYYTTPSNPIDAPKDIVYHEGLLKSLVESLGFNANSINEALAIIYSELADKKFCGISLSFGAGMVNSCISNYGVSVSQFSIAKSGDWIDQMTSQAQGLSNSRVMQLKEQQLDLSKEQTDIVLRTLSIYYDNLIDYVIKNIADKFSKDGKTINEKEGGVTIVVAGGTSMVPGFIERFSKKMEENKSKFPFTVSEIRHAKDPLFAVSNGCLVAGLSKERKQK